MELPLTRPVSCTPFVPQDAATRAERCELILRIQAEGLAKRMEHTHAKCGVLGISGGLDSCLALLVAVRACKVLGRDPKDIIALTMPCFGTTKRTRSNAEILCEALGVTLWRDQHHRDRARATLPTSAKPADKYDVTFENCQARVRTLELMDYANKNGGFVIGTGDLSELALGWATYNGDHMSMYGVNAGVPKTLVRHIVQYVADTCGKRCCGTCWWIFWTPRSAPSCCPPPRTARLPSRLKNSLVRMNCTTFTSTMCCALGSARQDLPPGSHGL